MKSMLTFTLALAIGVVATAQAGTSDADGQPLVERSADADDGQPLVERSADASDEEANEAAERATDCEWYRTSELELALACFDPQSGDPSPLYVITCGDGTVITYLGAGPGNGCNSSTGINECRNHQGCVSII